jgi:WD40 repeat protein
MFLLEKIVLTLIVVLALCSWVCIVSAEEPGIWKYESNKEISDISLSSDGSIITVGGERIFCFSKEGDLIWKEWSCEQIEISSDGEIIVYSNGNTLTLKGRDGNKIWEKNLGKIADIAISPDGSRIIAADIGCNVYFFNQSGDLLAERNIMHEGASRIQDLKITGNGVSVIVLTDKGWYYFYVDGRPQKRVEDDVDYDLRGNGGTLIDISNDGKVFVIVQDHLVKYYRQTSLLWKYSIKNLITCIALTPDGSYVAVGSRDNAVHFLDSEGKELWESSTGFWIRDIAITSDGSTIIAGSMDGRVYLFDTKGNVLSTIDVGGWVENVGITADGSFAVAASRQTVVGIPSSLYRTDANETVILEPEPFIYQSPIVTNEPVPDTPGVSVPDNFAIIILVGTLTVIAGFALLMLRKKE